VSTREAYRRCEAITRATAANFYYGIRLLAPERRRAMCAVYAFARRVDDIGDGELAREEKLRRLDSQARALAGLCGAAVSRAEVGVKSAGVPNAGVELPHAPGVGDGDAGVESLHDRSAGPPKSSMTDPVMVALADAYERFGVPPDALEALIEGVRMDVEGVAYESFDELVLYCRRVAGAIGRACLAIFALRDPAGTDLIEADRLADDLGVALQLTNILRDVREDAMNGRVYLPAEDLRRFRLIAAGGEHEAASTIAWLAERSEIGRRGIRRGGGDGADEEDRDEHADTEVGRLEALMRFQADRARGWFERGIALAPLLDRRSAACLLAMSGIYSRLLRRIAGDPERALRERIALSMREKAWVAARSMIGGSA
jgi:phytoene synthase